MGKALRKMQRGKAPSPLRKEPLQAELMKSFNKGVEAGAKHQRESDIVHLVKWLEQLEEVPGIGEKTASKVTRYFLENFGVK